MEASTMDTSCDEPGCSDHWEDDWDEEFDGLNIDLQESKSEDSDESNHHHDQSTAKPLRRRRRKRRNNFYIPRLFKRDIRRFYATMLANVSNAHDYSLFYSFFRTYAASDIVVKRHRVGTLQSLRTAIAYSTSCSAMARHYGDGGGTHEIRGILSFANALYCSTQMNPDQVVSVHNIQVITRPQSEISRVTFDMEVRFTHLYDLPPVVFIDNVLTVVNEYLTALAGNEEDTRRPITTDGGGIATLSTPHLMSPIGAEAASMHPIVDPLRLCSLVCGRPIRRCAKPVPVLVRVKTILHLDERRRIAVVETTDISYQQ